LREELRGQGVPHEKVRNIADIVSDAGLPGKWGDGWWDFFICTYAEKLADVVSGEHEFETINLAIRNVYKQLEASVEEETVPVKEDEAATKKGAEEEVASVAGSALVSLQSAPWMIKKEDISYSTPAIAVGSFSEVGRHSLLLRRSLPRSSPLPLIMRVCLATLPHHVHHSHLSLLYPASFFGVLGSRCLRDRTWGEKSLLRNFALCPKTT